MKRFVHWILERAGVGALLCSPLLLLYVLYIVVIASADRLLLPLTTLIFGEGVPFAGFLLALFFLIGIGALVKTKFGHRVTEKITSRIIYLRILVKAIQTGNVRRFLRARDDNAPNVIIAPYYRGPWPFIIFNVLPTTNPENPLVSGVFFDFPFLGRPNTVRPKETVFSHVSFDECLAFAMTAGAGLQQFSRPPKETTLLTHIQTEEFQRFMKETPLETP